MKKITAYIVCFLTVLALPLVASAQETTLITKIPSCHTLHIDIAGKGEVIIDGVSCNQTGDLQIQRGATPQIWVKPADGWVIKTVLLEDEDITQKLCKGTCKMPQMCLDAKLTVIFEAVPGTPQTGDPVPAAVLCLAMVLSFIGMLCCLLVPIKKDI